MQVPKCLDAFPVDIHVVSGVSANVVVNPAAHGGNAPVDANSCVSEFKLTHSPTHRTHSTAKNVADNEEEAILFSLGRSEFETNKTK